MASLRKGPPGTDWVIIASERSPLLPTRAVRDAPCPFCAGNEAATLPAISQTGGDDWLVRVVPNKFPALHPDASQQPTSGLYEEAAGVGRHEVIIECPDHVHDLCDLPPEQIERVLCTWRDRLLACRGDARLKSAVIFKNHGAAAGASQEHAHSQLIALPFVPARLTQELQWAAQYHQDLGTSAYEALLSREIADQTRIVHSNDEIVVFAPYASRFPFELWLLPRRHEAWYENADTRTYRSLAEALRVTCEKLNQALDHPPYNLTLHSAPIRDDSVSHFTWRLELIPTLTKVAGFERGTGVNINPVAPEEVARQLRDIEVRTWT